MSVLDKFHHDSNTKLEMSMKRKLYQALKDTYTSPYKGSDYSDAFNLIEEDAKTFIPPPENDTGINYENQRDPIYRFDDPVKRGYEVYEDPDIEDVLSSQGLGDVEDLKLQRTAVS